MTQQGENNNAFKHGRTDTPEYKTWQRIRERCYYPKNSSYKNYGGRGITVCDRWQGKEGFRNFYADLGPRPSPKHSLDRIDNNGNYEPGNVRWATIVEQENNRRNNVKISYLGETKTLAEWSRVTGFKYGVLQRRHSLGWDAHKTLTAPLGT